MKLNKTMVNILSRASEYGGLRGGDNEHVRKLVRAGYLKANPYGPYDAISHVISPAGADALAAKLNADAVEREESRVCGVDRAHNVCGGRCYNCGMCVET